MEFLLIGDSKLKIVMTGEDMSAFKLDGSTDTSSAGYRRNFWRVLELAKNEVGFDPEGDKILLQFYPLKDGGCEIFVTKLGILSKESAKMVTKSDKVTMLSRVRRVYAFDTKDDLLKFVASVKNLTVSPYPSVDIYKTESAGYYMLIEEFLGNGFAEIPALYEYSRPLNSELEYFVTEHLERLTNGNGIEEIESMI